MRKRVVRNELFYHHYPYKEPSPDEQPPPSANGEAPKPNFKYRRPSSRDSRLWHERHSPAPMLERREAERSLHSVLDYDDCDVAVTDKTLDIDEQIKNMGMQVNIVLFPSVKIVLNKSFSRAR